MARVTLDAVFDGLVFRPLDPPEELAPNSRVRITVEVDAPLQLPPESTEGEEDLDSYIYEHYVYSEFHRG